MTWQHTLDTISNLDWGVITGMVALIFTAISLWVQRKHNILSVRPIAIISVGDYENELAVYLQNKGMGPLIIKELSFMNENGRKEKSIIAYFDDDFKSIVWETFVADIDGWAILPNETKTLIKLSGDSSDKDFVLSRDKARKVLASISVDLQIQDVYNNNFPRKIRKLDYFSR